jgi:hypothetical protein
MHRYGTQSFSWNTSLISALQLPDCDTSLQVQRFVASIGTLSNSGVPKGGLGDSNLPRNSEVLTKLSRIPSSVEKTSGTTLDIPKFWQSRTGLQIERNPWLGGYRPQIPLLSALCPQLNLLNPLPPNKIPGYATAQQHLQTEQVTRWMKGKRLRYAWPALLLNYCTHYNLLLQRQSRYKHT